MEQTLFVYVGHFAVAYLLSGIRVMEIPPIAFLFEYVFYALVTILVMPLVYIQGLLALGAFGHHIQENDPRKIIPGR